MKRRKKEEEAPAMIRFLSAVHGWIEIVLTHTLIVMRVSTRRIQRILLLFRKLNISVSPVISVVHKLKFYAIVKSLNILFFVFLAAASPLLAQEKRDIGYAQYLFKAGFYSESRAEFLYQSYASPDRIIREKSLLWASKSLLENGSFVKAEREFSKICSSNKESDEIKKAARFEYLRALYFQKKFYRLDGDCLDHPSQDLRENLLQFWSLVATNQWERAETLAHTIDARLSGSAPDDKTVANDYRSASDLLEKRPSFDAVSPELAAALSAALPGAGHAYAGNWTNAFGAFILNAVFISLTAYSVTQKNYAVAGVCGFLEVGWYSGNIISAYQTAELRNKADQLQYQKRINEFFPFKIGYSYPF
jgi:hypothetical protein